MKKFQNQLNINSNRKLCGWLGINGILPVSSCPIIFWLPSIKFDESWPYPNKGFSIIFFILNPHIIVYAHQWFLLVFQNSDF